MKNETKPWAYAGMDAEHRSMTLAERFWEKVDRPGDTDACWEWQGGLTRYGYGRFVIKGKRAAAHRISWELTRGATLTPDVFICHSCDNRRCVRPDHLFAGTPKDNIADMWAKGRQAEASKWGHPGESHSLHKLTDNDVRAIRALRQAGMTTTAIAARFGVTQSNVSHITTRRSWKHIA